MSTELVLLALGMFAVTYPSRAIPLLTPGLERLPPKALTYLRLVGPAVLASLGITNTFVILADDGSRSFHLGIETVAIALAACLQLDLAIPNLLIQETGLGIHYDDGFALTDYLVDPSVFHVVDGHLLPPAGPGLGIEVDQAAVDRAAAVGHRWRNPVWRHPDGSFAEW